ncbi:flagellar hook capping FlgD N-terminal domain-containing protein [Tropicimonas sp. TH_r6]|uniref:flagellar hook capping FlgD N-terminal domain-containing protein n=1 Tax=Tropicimonas sp. TH_r6 TaxID=3082085 RepID=UPI002953CA4D|nr:flagellar hook capping FlgD N-terminal domain-containing protein [Tropicimonas sp. TH_r6]MDV7144775.1 flagellar hook capping FlgD N-terminal domain-containing protein [Tropicimonas sp. TH_r6]
MTTVDTSTAASLTSAANTTVSSSTAISSDFETWMSLLTAQLQNQDPFDPVDSTEYTAQLAQFSSVEQQVLTNDLLGDLISVSTSSDMASMAEWVGKEVRVATPADYLGNPIEVHASSDPVAYSAQLVVKGPYGSEVGRFPIDTGESDVMWEGTDSEGKAVSWGSYSFEVESFDSNGVSLGVDDAEIYTEVLEVQRVGDQYALVLPNGSAVTTDDVSAVRNLD